MELSKIRLNNFKTFPKHINIQEKLNTIIDIFDDLIEQKSLDVKIKCSDTLQQVPIELDEARFGLIIFNIINNAAKYTKQGDSITISARLVKQNEMNLLVAAMKSKNHDSEEVTTNHFSNIVHTASDVSISN